MALEELYIYYIHFQFRECDYNLWPYDAKHAAKIGHQWDKTLCIIYEKQRCRGNVTVQLCQTLERSKKLKDSATFHNDDAGFRNLSCLYLVAADALFHKRCSDLYLLDHVRGKRRAEINIGLLVATHNNDEEEHNIAIFYRKLLSHVIGDSVVLGMTIIIIIITMSIYSAP